MWTKTVVLGELIMDYFFTIIIHPIQLLLFLRCVRLCGAVDFGLLLVSMRDLVKKIGATFLNVTQIGDTDWLLSVSEMRPWDKGK